MKQLYYALRTLLRGHGSNIIKVISLTLGLLVGIVLFARVAFEMSFNTGYNESDNLAVVMANYHINGMTNAPMQVVMGPVPRTIMSDFPEEVEAATLVHFLYDTPLYVGEQRFTGNVMMADTLFFKTMGIPITSGSAMELTVPNIVFVSEDFAKRTFATTDVIGNTYMHDKTTEYTIRGTYATVGVNNSVRPDVVVSIAGYPDYMGWKGGDSFKGYVRLKNPEDIVKINKRIDTVIDQYMPFDLEKDSFWVRYHLENIREEYISNPNMQRLIMIMSFLAFAILFIAAMNYVLIAISGLARRAKGIGVHKCNGATSMQVFRMFLLETGIIIGISVLFVVVLIFNMRSLIEEIIEVKIASLFTLQTLWVPLLIILFVFIMAGVIPGRIFSNIPVTQVFRKYSERNSSWKRVLLFIQFGGVAFVFGILVVVFAQYNRMMNYDMGYRPDNIVVAQTGLPNMELANATIGNLPMVESSALSWLTVGDGYSGEMVKDGSGKELFSTRFNIVSPEFVSLYGFTIVEGRNIIAPGEVLVSEEYVRQMPWTDGALGKQSSSSNSFGTVVGVMKDFVDGSLYVETRPIAFVSIPGYYRSISVKLREPFAESLQNLNREMKELFPTNDVVFHSLEKRIEDQYASVRRFRDSAGVAFLAILFITIMGLFGYINDEMQRRSKEIAIRKVNGAESWSILGLLSREVALVAIPSILAGIIFSYFVGKEWLEQFAATRTDLSAALYILLSICLLIMIILSVFIKSWRIANENPVISLRSE